MPMVQLMRVDFSCSAWRLWMLPVALLIAMGWDSCAYSQAWSTWYLPGITPSLRALAPWGEGERATERWCYAYRLRIFVARVLR